MCVCVNIYRVCVFQTFADTPDLDFVYDDADKHHAEIAGKKKTSLIIILLLFN